MNLHVVFFFYALGMPITSRKVLKLVFAFSWKNYLFFLLTRCACNNRDKKYCGNKKQQWYEKKTFHDTHPLWNMSCAGICKLVILKEGYNIESTSYVSSKTDLHKNLLAVIALRTSLNGSRPGRWLNCKSTGCNSRLEGTGFWFHKMMN